MWSRNDPVQEVVCLLHMCSHRGSHRPDNLPKSTQQFQLTAALTPGTRFVHCPVLPLRKGLQCAETQNADQNAKHRRVRPGSGPTHDLQRGVLSRNTPWGCAPRPACDYSRWKCTAHTGPRGLSTTLALLHYRRFALVCIHCSVNCAEGVAINSDLSPPHSKLVNQSPVV